MLSLSASKAFLQLLISLCIRSVMIVCAFFYDFLFVSLVTNWVSLDEVCLPSFDVLNCWLNLVASCLDDENEIPLRVIASFSASRFAPPSIPLIVRHSLVTSVFCSKVSTKSVLDVIIQSWQFMRGGISRSSRLVITSNISAGTGSLWRLCRPLGML